MDILCFPGGRSLLVRSRTKGAMRNCRDYGISGREYLILNEMSPLFLSRVHVRTGKAISIQSHCDLLYFLWNQPHTNRGGRKSLLTNYRFSPKLDSSLLFFPSQATIPKSQIYEFTLFFLLLYRSLHPRLIHGPLVSFTGFTFP